MTAGKPSCSCQPRPSAMAAPSPTGSGFCPHCGANVLPNHAFCSKCGVRVADGPGPNLPGVPVCVNCGSPVDMGGSFCWKCGVPLETGRAPRIPEGALEGSSGEPPRPSAELPDTSTPSDRIRDPDSLPQPLPPPPRSYPGGRRRGRLRSPVSCWRP